MPAKAGIQSKRNLCDLDSSFRWNDEQWNLGFPLSAGRFIVWRGEPKCGMACAFQHIAWLWQSRLSSYKMVIDRDYSIKFRFSA